MCKTADVSCILIYIQYLFFITRQHSKEFHNLQKRIVYKLNTITLINYQLIAVHFIFLFYCFKSELSADLVKGAECSYSLCGLLSVTWSTLSQSSGGMFLRLLLGSEQLSSVGYGLQQTNREMSRHIHLNQSCSGNCMVTVVLFETSCKTEK